MQGLRPNLLQLIQTVKSHHRHRPQQNMHLLLCFHRPRRQRHQLQILHQMRQLMLDKFLLQHHQHHQQQYIHQHHRRLRQHILHRLR